MQCFMKAIMSDRNYKYCNVMLKPRFIITNS